MCKLTVLAYHEDTSWGFTCGVKSPKFFDIASILPVFWGNRGFFFYQRKKRRPVIRIFGGENKEWNFFFG
jgi:hypothetical protein